MKSPLIAIPMDYLDVNHDPEAAWYSKYPWYAVKHRYHDAIAASGAIPCFIGYEHSLIPNYVKQFDGLLITGGHFDHDPNMYNAPEIHETTKIRIKRSQFEKALLEAFMTTHKPVLGICGGHQLLNIIHGGTLYQHIPSQLTSDIKHTLTNPPTEAAHSIEIVPNTKLHQWSKQLQARVNSSHHQGIQKLGSGLVTNAMSKDGLIEGIEHPNHPFCFGTQWHPEYFVDPIDRLIIEKFVSSCV